MEVSAQILCVEYFLHKPLSEIDISVDFLQRDIQNPIPNVSFQGFMKRL